MKCILGSVKYGWLTEKAPYFGICDYIKRGKTQTEYIEGDANFIFEKLKEIAAVTRIDDFILTIRDDGDIEAMIYDDYIE